MPVKQTYIGRFAPSPTGPLHLGSLYTALAGFLQARSQQGQWLLRIDDLDTPRNIKGAADTILKTLEIFGLHWDGNVYYQSHKREEYEAILNELKNNERVYPCTCSRKELSHLPAKQALPDIYPGICRDKQAPAGAPHALRVKTDHCIISFQDDLQGLISANLAERHGDFILKRKDRIIAYQLAVVIDDHRQNITHVVRGSDLLDSTPKQIFLQQQLEWPAPGYMHVPILVDRQGYKLSKQTFAQAVDLKTPHQVIFQLLSLLKQKPPAELQQAPAAELLGWAQNHWNPAPLKNLRAISP
ncbi:glutamyl-Q tRNA(Asp) synthetase [Candidatus Methylobacter favarea]|uniref:Glutamyl-Q tRNA(Asp) synthetase n=1 Tax=Candidatus Methylobacter favarea TaxID=2707345 RepID=A0A8S0WM49_9GAMM|nr:tRNA glutamyl-Q(34) synthetase GluQRS [Candidatus Methylobacter favarea]CAA9889520.1 glutamyl-Q tRNA(Asp) synthetase [Candidatus Methylobacter favarea]